MSLTAKAHGPKAGLSARDLTACHAQRLTGNAAESIRCPRADTCARFAAGKHAIEARSFYSAWMQPPPAAEVCAEFVETQPVSTT